LLTGQDGVLRQIQKEFWDRRHCNAISATLRTSALLATALTGSMFVVVMCVGKVNSKRICKRTE
jgi:hypothetical protein